MYLPDIIDNFGKTNNIAHIYRENILTYEDLKKKSDALASLQNKTPSARL
jgi:hypothetical protein